MSFTYTLWASLTQTYVLVDRTRPMNEVTPHQLTRLREQQELAEQQYSEWRMQQQLPQPQALYPQALQPQPSVQVGFPAAHVTHTLSQSFGGHWHVNVPGNRAGVGYTNGNQAQYEFAQPTTDVSSSWVPLNYYYPPAATLHYEQAPSIHWSYGYPSTWAHGGDAYGYWSQQQQAQQQHAWPGYHHGWSGPQNYAGYAQQPIYGPSSYLNPAGVPFDLHQTTTQPQFGQGSASQYDIYRSTYAQQLESSKLHDATHRPLVADSPSAPGKPPYRTQSVTMGSLSTFRPYYSNYDKLKGEHSEAAIRHSTPQTYVRVSGTHQGQCNGEQMYSDKQPGFDLVEPSPELGLPCSRSTIKRLFRSLSRSERHLLQPQTTLKDLDPKLKESPRPSTPAFQTVQSRRTLAPESKARTPPSIRTGRLQLLEHSVDSKGNLQTIVQKIGSSATMVNRRTCGKNLRKIYVPVSHLKELAEGVLLPADKLQAFDADCERDERKPTATQTGLANSKSTILYGSSKWMPSESQFSGPREGSKKELIETFQTTLITKPSASRGVQSSMTDSSPSSSPPTKRVKGEPTSSLDIKQTKSKTATELMTTTSHTTGGWSNFAAHIAQDDKNMVMKARENLKRLNEGFRPEFRETYKDQKGRKETTIHEKVAGSMNEAVIQEPRSRHAKEAGERDTGDETVVVDRAYHTDSSEGGIALSRSDLDTESWVGIKTGNENEGWKRN